MVCYFHRGRCHLRWSDEELSSLTTCLETYAAPPKSRRQRYWPGHCPVAMRKRIEIPVMPMWRNYGVSAINEQAPTQHFGMSREYRYFHCCCCWIVLAICKDSMVIHLQLHVRRLLLVDLHNISCDKQLAFCALASIFSCLLETFLCLKRYLTALLLHNSRYGHVITSPVFTFTA